MPGLLVGEGSLTSVIEPVAGSRFRVSNGAYIRVSTPHEPITLHPQLDDILPQPGQLGPLGLAQLVLTVVGGATRLGAPVTQRALI